MGMYDSAYLPCPKCRTRVEFQSKSGQCILGQYTEADIPIDVAPGLVDKSYNTVCGNCGAYLAAQVEVVVYVIEVAPIRGAAKILARPMHTDEESP